MSTTIAWSRRGVLRSLLAVAGAWPTQAPAQLDQGIGGTGFLPEGPENDRGIGGTGVLGTIRGFGSILVNDLRITFPRTVAVEIDGRRSRTTDLRRGQVVRVLAAPGRTALETRLIRVESEVVGPVASRSHGEMIVLGQRIVPGDALRGWRRWRPGQVVAVSGLRRFDGVIVAGWIGRRRRGEVQIAGTPREDAAGAAIGDLPIAGLAPDGLGRRVVVRGAVVGGVLIARSVSITPPLLDDGVRRLSLEDYVAIDGGEVRLASGLQIPEGSDVSASVGEARAIVSADVGLDGTLSVKAVHFVADARSGRTDSRPSTPGGPQSGPGPGGPPPGMRPGSAPGPNGAPAGSRPGDGAPGDPPGARGGGPGNGGPGSGPGGQGSGGPGSGPGR